MGIDLFILGLMAFFGLLGALSGASRQLAQIAALIVAGLFTRPLSGTLAPFLSEAMGGPAILGVVVAYLLVFIALFSVVRWAVSAVLRRMLSAGEEKEQHGADRPLGFLVGVAKVVVVAWVFTSAAVFAEEHIQIAGNKLSLASKDSVAFALARSHNLFDYAQAAQAKTFMELGQASLDPERRKELATTDGYASVRRDPRFRKALSDPQVKEALQAGDWRAALQNEAVLGMVQDTQFLVLMEQTLATFARSTAGLSMEPPQAPEDGEQTDEEKTGTAQRAP